MEGLLTDKNLKIIGGLFTALGTIFSLLQVSVCWPLESISCTYITLSIIPLGLAMYLLGGYNDKLDGRREVSQDEIQTLCSEYERNATFDSDAAKIAKNEIDRIKQFQGKLVELEVLPLRQALVDLYEKEELITKAKYELTLLKEYGDDDPDLVEDWNNRINDLIKKDEQIKETNIKKLRYELKSLRETVSYYDKTYAEGEVIFKRVLYWAAITAIVAIFIGLLPILHVQGNKIIGIENWLSFGIAGALLSVLAGIHDPSIPELGETKGKQVLQRVILGIAIGGSASILLYAALIGGILSGKIFPTVPIMSINDSNYWINTGASIFWSLFAGFGLRVFASLVGIAEGAFGKKDED